MARKDDDLFVEDELTAAFLGEDDFNAVEEQMTTQAAGGAADDWAEPEEEAADDIPGQLALDVYETKESLVVKCRVAGVNKEDLDVSIADNTLTIRGTLSAGVEEEVENYFVQECYWGEFARSISLPAPVKEDEIQAVLKDGVLTVGFTKVKQDTVKKIAIQ